MRIVKENKWLLSLFAFALCIMACFTITSSVTKVSANSTKGNLDYSLAGVSQAATIYINTISSPGYHGAQDVPSNICAGDAGGLIGFSDDDATDRNYWLCSRDSANVCVWSYGKLAGIARRQNGSSVTSYILCSQGGPLGYALYGYALGELGLDEVDTASNESGLRMVIGIAMMALYVLAVGMSTFFNLVISILQFANPFRMFASAANMNGWISRYPTGASDSFGIGAALTTFATQVGKIYDLAHNISLFLLVPMFLAISLFMWLVVNKGANFTKIFKPFLIRLLFIVLGVPLMFGVYGVILDAIQGHITASNSPATTVVGSLFCDFDAWAESDNNLDPPTNYDITIDVGTMEVDSADLANVRNICYAINKSNYPSVFTETLTDGSNGMDSYQKYDTTITADTNKPTYVIGSTTPTSVSQDANAIGTALSILQKYSRGDKISAGAYESSAVKQLVAGNLEETIIMFGTSSTWQDYDSDEAGAFEYKGNDGGGGGTNGKNTGLNINKTDAEVAAYASGRWTGSYGSADIFGDGNLKTSISATGGYRWSASARSATGTATYTHGGNKALSSLSLYNYLNTKFTSTEIRVSSPTATSNDQIKYQHFAVSMVGNSFMRFIYLADAMILLSCISIIGYGYGFAMLVGNFKALFKMIPNVLTGMLGSIRGIASAFALMFAMVCEVVGTILMFDIAVEIIFACYRIVEIPLAKALQTGGLSNLTSTVGGNVATGLLGVVSCVVILSITKQLLSWRTAIVGATTAACTNFVNKLLDTSVSAPNIDDGGRGVLAKAGTAALAGASLAMGASRGLYGEDAKNAVNDFKGKLSSGEFTEGLKEKMGAEFGVKSGNGTGEPVGLVADNGATIGQTDEFSTDGMDATEAALAQEEHARSIADAERAGAGLTNEDTKSDAYVAANTDSFEAALDGSESSSLVGDDDRDKSWTNDDENEYANGNWMGEYTQHNDFANGHSDSFSQVDPVTGKKVNGTREVSDDGTVTTTIKTNDPSTGEVSTSKLVDSDSTRFSSTDTYGPDGESHVTETIDKASGTKTVTQDIRNTGGRTLVEQRAFNDGGNDVTVTKTVAPNGSTTVETTTVDGVSGDKTINREVTAKGGTTYVNETVHTDESTGNVVTTTTTSGNGSGLRGGHMVTQTTTNAGGEVLHESTTTYSSANQVVERDVTDVVRTDQTVTETHTTMSGGITNTVKTVTNDAAGSQVKYYKTTGSNGVSTQKTETFIKQTDGSYAAQQVYVAPSNAGVARPTVVKTQTTQPGSTVTVQNTVVQQPNTVKQVNMFDNNGGADKVFTTSNGSTGSAGGSTPPPRGISSMFRV